MPWGSEIHLREHQRPGATNNLTDAATVLMTALGVKVASTLSGARHQNGHGRIEWLVGIVASCAIVLAGWEALRSSIDAIRHPAAAEFQLFVPLVMVASIVVKLFLFRYNAKRGQELDSSAYRAAAADCIGDAVSTAMVAAAFLADALLGLHVDGWCGALVSLFILRNGLKSFAEVSRRVLGEIADRALSERLERYVLAYDGALIGEVCDLQLLDYGSGRYGAFFTARMKEGADRDRFLLRIADLKSAIYGEFGYIATIEPEVPASPAEQRRIWEIVRRRVGEIDDRLAIAEGTRVNAGGAGSQAVLRIALPFEYSMREGEFDRRLREKLAGEDFSYTAKLVVDGSRRRRA